MKNSLITNPRGSNDNQPAPHSTWLFRKLWGQDTDALAAHLLRLDPEQRSFRFGRAVADEWVERYARGTDWLRSVILGCWIAGELRGVGEIKLLDQAWPRSAEAALSVERRFEGRGIGTELFHRGLVLARNRGIARVSMLSRPENLRVRHIIGTADPVATYGGDQVECEIRLAPPDALSLAAELYDDGCALALTIWSNLAPAA
jgi:ribosomal protein S18 acetylase RimI-like enzyme